MSCTSLPQTVSQLESLLALPSPGLVQLMSRLEGDLMILGIAGKMGISMGIQAVHAIRMAGVDRQVYGVSRFSRPEDREKLEAHGIRTIPCDLLDRSQVARLPQVRNIIFMAGRKFGTAGSEELTWAMNVLAPANVAEHFTQSRIVAFSTGCVYPLRSVSQGGCTEADAPAPLGEYSQSCLGRERMLQYWCARNQTPLLILRLNYAVDLRYGVLHDIGRAVWEGRPVDRAVDHFNVIWQGDANANAILALQLADCPCGLLNVTGPETASVTRTALEMGRIMGKEVAFLNNPADRNYLSDATRMGRLFGYPRVSLGDMIDMQAHWIANGGESLGKPTHFEVNNGNF